LFPRRPWTGFPRTQSRRIVCGFVPKKNTARRRPRRASRKCQAASTSTTGFVSLVNPGQSWQFLGHLSNANGWRWGVRTSDSKNQYSYGDYEADPTTAFLVARVKQISGAAQSLDLWVNPEDMSSVGALGTPTASFPCATHNSNVSTGSNLFTGFKVSADKGRYIMVDEIRVGTELRDVILGPSSPGTLLIAK